jgi:dephospho-CoA kinase
MLRVALTGGIATGKTHVLARFAELGVPTIDADALVHAAMAPGTETTRRIAARFGPEALGAGGAVDRKALGRLIFDDAHARGDLEAILHPQVYDAIEGWLARLERAGRALALADIPLLYETGHDADFDRVIVTACAPERQLQRMMNRDGLSEPDARRRLAAQWPVEEKARRADFVVRTDSTFEDTDRQVREIHQALIAAARNM